MTIQPFKLRAWDDRANKMYYGTIEQFDDMLGFRFEHFETETPQYMKFTGIQDKNGNDIYEDDIVKFEDSTPKVVKFMHGQNFKVAAFYIFPSDIFLFYDDDDKLEIIGNIYENPELVKEL